MKINDEMVAAGAHVIREYIREIINTGSDPIPSDPVDLAMDVLYAALVKAPVRKPEGGEPADSVLEEVARTLYEQDYPVSGNWEEERALETVFNAYYRRARAALDVVDHEIDKAYARGLKDGEIMAATYTLNNIAELASKATSKQLDDTFNLGLRAGRKMEREECDEVK